jgi:hypothetical protein
MLEKSQIAPFFSPQPRKAENLSEEEKRRQPRWISLLSQEIFEMCSGYRSGRPIAIALRC